MLVAAFLVKVFNNLFDGGKSNDGSKIAVFLLSSCVESSVGKYISNTEDDICLQRIVVLIAIKRPQITIATAVAYECKYIN